MIDAENIDPAASFKNKTNSYSQTNKRSKTSIFTKSVHFETTLKPTFSTLVKQNSTTSALPTTTKLQRKIAKPRSRLQTCKTTTLSNDSSSTSDKMLETRVNSPAGRSPQTGRPPVSSLLSDRARPATPAFGVSRVRDSYRIGMVKSASHNSTMSSAKGAMPFDLSAALQGTVPSGHSSRSNSITGSADVGNVVQATLTKSNSAPALLDPPPKAHPAAWYFEIFEDTEDQERENIVSHYAEHLGISDDESSSTRDYFNSDKENIPPSDYSPASTPRRSQRHALAIALGIAPTVANGLARYQDDENDENDATPIKRHLALSLIGEPAEDCGRSVPGGLTRSPGMMDLAQHSSPAPKKRSALGELPLEEFTPVGVYEAEEKGEESGELLARDSALSPINEHGSEEIVEDEENQMDSSVEAEVQVQVQVSPPRTSSLLDAESI